MKPPTSLSRLFVFLISIWFGLDCLIGFLAAQDSDSDKALKLEAANTLKKACRFYASKISIQGGYPYHSTIDGASRWGENMELRKSFIMQPPGTPSVGAAFLQAYEATGDYEYLELALATGRAIAKGQLRSGGWAQVVYLEKPEKGRMGNYRKRTGGEWNQSSLDDNQTQSAILFLVELDRVLGHRDEEINETAQFALAALLAAQLPNGGFPQGWREPARSFVTAKANYPQYDWKSEGRLKNYWDYSTLNDGLVGDVAEVFIRAFDVYHDERYLNALKRLGDFLLLAQMPDPQPAWCQQYNDSMQPIWARKFEPPAIAGSESQDAMLTLLRIAEVSRDRKYLEPIPRALRYFREKCLLADGRLARFYELQTNRPLYMDKQYQLSYDDSQVPSHYGWKNQSKLNQIEKSYELLSQGITRERKPKRVSPMVVREVIKMLGDDGSWSHVYQGEKLMGSPKFRQDDLYVSSADFIENVDILTRYISSLSSK